jgi:hypothetical protein
MLAREARDGAIAQFGVNSVAEKEYSVEAASGGSSKFRASAFGFHQFLNNGESETGSSEYATFIGSSPEAIKRPFPLLVAQAGAFIDDVDRDDGARP